MAIELYHTNWSICAQKVRLVIAEKGLDVIEHHIDLREREQQTPEYLKLNPNGYVPTLVHGGKAIIESSIICEYLDEVFPEPALVPSSAAARAYMRTWTRRPDDGLHRACATITNAIAFRLQWLEKSTDEIQTMLAATPDPIRRAWRREMIEKGTSSDLFVQAIWSFDKVLSDMEKALCGKKWLVGDKYTLADISLTSYINRVAELQLHAMWEGTRARVTEWITEVRARQNFSNAFGDYPYEAYRLQMAEQGARQWPRVEAILSD